MKIIQVIKSVEKSNARRGELPRCTAYEVWLLRWIIPEAFSSTRSFFFHLICVSLCQFVSFCVSLCRNLCQFVSICVILCHFVSIFVKKWAKKNPVGVAALPWRGPGAPGPHMGPHGPHMGPHGPQWGPLGPILQFFKISIFSKISKFWNIILNRSPGSPGPDFKIPGAPGDPKRH